MKQVVRGSWKNVISFLFGELAVAALFVDCGKAVVKGMPRNETCTQKGGMLLEQEVSCLYATE